MRFHHHAVNQRLHIPQLSGSQAKDVDTQYENLRMAIRKFHAHVQAKAKVGNNYYNSVYRFSSFSSFAQSASSSWTTAESDST